MLVYRILHKKYGDPLYAPGIEGRWNTAGQKVLYCSESIPLAFMESMIRRRGAGFNNDFGIAFIEIPNTAYTKTVELKDLTPNWNQLHNYSACQKPTKDWYNNMESLALKVPSAVLSICNNYVLNTLHKEFKKVKLIGLTPLIPDPGVDELLKKAK